MRVSHYLVHALRWPFPFQKYVKRRKTSLECLLCSICKCFTVETHFQLLWQGRKANTARIVTHNQIGSWHTCGCMIHIQPSVWHTFNYGLWLRAAEQGWLGPWLPYFSREGRVTRNPCTVWENFYFYFVKHIIFKILLSAWLCR